VQHLTEAKALTALANPFRSRMLDALRVDGPSTASGLAQRTGQAVGSVSHHLKVLAEAQLIEEAPELARDRRERWWRLSAPSRRWSRSEFADDQPAVAAALAAENLQLARQFERAQAWQDNHEAEAEWADAAFATQSWLRLSPDELRALSRELIGLLERWSDREVPDDGQDREPILLFARAFPAQP
jgi:DNA-binding transcriptional ArsR family regulator